jgi:hypothetical protein
VQFPRNSKPLSIYFILLKYLPTNKQHPLKSLSYYIKNYLKIHQFEKYSVQKNEKMFDRLVQSVKKLYQAFSI